MHIPDGYLSPSTCAALYAGASPFWYVALKRVGKALSSRLVPSVAVFAAFSFVIMMFNLPLPGGTTGHAVGLGITAIVLGPWISILSISAALLVQALLFGDGGITAYGANCFNMAIVGSLVAYATYRLAAIRATLTSKRRVVAAGLAGYVGINAAALCAAVEFGIQPMLFHDAAGTPLYAPYPLSISIPAMMLGHLTFAGLAEMVISAGLVAYLQRADVELLRRTAGDAPASEMPLIPRKLWALLGALLLLTPLGILAAGTAWGEWRPTNLRHPPSGLVHLSGLWKAPLVGYKPHFVGNAAAGYFLSAAIGVAIIVLLLAMTAWLMPHRKAIGFIEGTLRSLLAGLESSIFSEETAQLHGLLQPIDPRVKLTGIGMLIIAVISVHKLWLSGTLFLVAVGLALLSKISLGQLARRVWLAVLGFTGAIAVPALFLAPGGRLAAAFLILRAETAATLVFLLFVTTQWNQLLRSLRVIGIPASMVAILEITYRYIFLLLRTSQDMFESRQTRLLGRLEPREQRRFASSIAGVLLDKTFQLSSDVYFAMQARGFRGNIVLLEDSSITAGQLGLLAVLLAIGLCAIWFGH